MNTALRSFVPNWFKHGESDMPDDHEIPPLPQTAIVPMPEPTEEERRLKVIADAHVFVAQLGHEREGYRRQIERVETENTELKEDVKKEKCRGDLLELELAQALNNMQTRETDFAEKERTLQLLRQVLDKFGTKAPPKP
jgi:hypothetical protein